MHHQKDTIINPAQRLKYAGKVMAVPHSARGTTAILLGRYPLLFLAPTLRPNVEFSAMPAGDVMPRLGRASGDCQVEGHTRTSIGILGYLKYSPCGGFIKEICASGRSTSSPHFQHNRAKHESHRRRGVGVIPLGGCFSSSSALSCAACKRRGRCGP
jgi:hypothetical protein